MAGFERGQFDAMAIELLPAVVAFPCDAQLPRLLVGKAGAGRPLMPGRDLAAAPRPKAAMLDMNEAAAAFSGKRIVHGFRDQGAERFRQGRACFRPDHSRAFLVSPSAVSRRVVVSKWQW